MTCTLSERKLLVLSVDSLLTFTSLMSKYNTATYSTNPSKPQQQKANDNAIDSLVPIFYAQLGGGSSSIDAAWQATADLITDRIKDFDEAADRLCARYKKYNSSDVDSDSGVLQKKLQGFVEGCRYICRGNVRWRYVSVFVLCCTANSRFWWAFLF